MNKTFFDEKAEVGKWLDKISRAENKYREYHRLFADIRRYYRNETKADKQNIFWSSVETLKPFLYFKQPKPYIEQKNKTAGRVQNMACRILEKALVRNLEHFDFDSVIKYARNDFLLGGTGLVIERYRPSFGIVEDINGRFCEIKTDEHVTTEYLNPVDFIADTDKVGIWEDCNWFAIRKYLSLEEAVAGFGDKLLSFINMSGGGQSKFIEIYEIWDKSSERVLFVSKSCPDKFLNVIEGGLSISGFYPMPKPLFATCTNDTLIPVPDYVQIKPLLDELDGVTSRMERTMKALKVSGCYDNAFPELASILNKDITLVSVSDFDRLKSAGGIKNIVDFMPIDQYITALQALAQRRQDIVNSIYEITGVSDIMRGTSNAGDTATAVTQKTNFGTLRNQDRQNDMQRFIAELFKIKAEIICEQFSAEKLVSFLPPEEQIIPEAYAAVRLLKTDKLRDMVLGIESDVTFGEGAQAKKNVEAITTIHNMIGQAFDVVSKQPALLDLYRQMISSVVSSLSNARQYENVLSGCFDRIAQEFNQPEPPEQPVPNPQMLSLQLQMRKNEQDFAIKKEQNDLKRIEVLSKQVLTNKEMDLQAALKSEGRKNGDISTGLVKDFN